MLIHFQFLGKRFRWILNIICYSKLLLKSVFLFLNRQKANKQHCLLFFWRTCSFDTAEVRGAECGRLGAAIFCLINVFRY